MANIDTTLKELADIATWFENQDEVQVEEGLEKVKKASALIKESKARLQEIENEFEEIKKELDPQTEEVTIKETVIEITTDDTPDEMPF
jgi:exonuclease VII small subunit